MPKQVKKKQKVNREPGLHLHKTLSTGGKGKFYFILIGKNGQTLMSSEMYNSKQSGVKGCKAVLNYFETIHHGKPIGRNNGYYYDHTKKGDEIEPNLIVV